MKTKMVLPRGRGWGQISALKGRREFRASGRALVSSYYRPQSILFLPEAVVYVRTFSVAKACVSARSLAAVRSDLARISVTVAS